MKWLIFFITSMLIFSCDKEQEKISILNAIVAGEKISFTGNAHRYKDIRNDKPVGYDFHIFNLESPKLYIKVYDSSFSRHEFEFPDVEVKYVYNATNGAPKTYYGYSGILKITKEQEGVIFGEFKFILINKFDSTDTIYIDNGYYEITLEKNDRLWDN